MKYVFVILTLSLNSFAEVAEVQEVPDLFKKTNTFECQAKFMTTNTPVGNIKVAIELSDEPLITATSLDNKVKSFQIGRRNFMGRKVPDVYSCRYFYFEDPNAIASIEYACASYGGMPEWKLRTYPRFSFNFANGMGNVCKTDMSCYTLENCNWLQ